MTKKQAKGVELSSTQTETPQDQKTKTLFLRVDTFDKDGRTIGTRIVDLYHFGTRNWMANHMWWAAHNGHTIETNVANDDEVNAYVEKQKAALAERFQSEKAHQAA